MGRYLSCLTGAVGLVTIIMSSASAAVIFSDNFDTEDLGRTTTLDNFGTIRGSVTVVPNGGRGIFCAGDAGSCVLLNAGSDIFSFDEFGPGELVLIFDLAGNPASEGNLLQVLYGTTLLDTISITSSTSFKTYSYDVSGSGRIRFRSGAGDPVLDNVQLLTRDTTPIPEPSSLMAMISAIGILGLVSWRHRQS